VDCNEIPYDTREDLPNQSSGYAWCDEITMVVETLAIGNYDLDDHARSFINFLVEWGEEKGYLTWGEARYLGGLWKFHVNDGVYVYHDWWTKDNKLSPENVNKLKKRFYEKMKQIKGR
jgi:hypothetical protein